MRTDHIAYKIMTSADFRQMQQRGQYAGSDADIADGFIHLSTAGQISATLDKHYPDQSHLVILAINLSVCGAALRWEPSRGDDLFPHIYAALSIDAVAAHGTLCRAADGAVMLPTP
ncbi:MAG: glutathione S-transferase [Rhodospirillales bacterium 20-60-12]|nr:MAG: glutathione S-transferase [Rhodospirillales bacterium 20-60-12]HQT67891.1 DUF952 domain-containing protein [Acetobacteraceae bacterium]